MSRRSVERSDFGSYKIGQLSPTNMSVKSKIPVGKSVGRPPIRKPNPDVPYARA